MSANPLPTPPATTPTPVSPPRVYSFRTWAVKNKAWLKTGLSAIGGVLAFYLLTIPEPWRGLASFGVAGVTKWAADWIDFQLDIQVPLPEVRVVAFGPDLITPSSQHDGLSE